MFLIDYIFECKCIRHAYLKYRSLLIDSDFFNYESFENNFITPSAPFAQEKLNFITIDIQTKTYEEHDDNLKIVKLSYKNVSGFFKGSWNNKIVNWL